MKRLIHLAIVGLMGVSLIFPGSIWGAVNDTNTTSTSANSSESSNALTGLVQCGTSRDCTICDIFILFRDVFNLVLQFLASAGVIMIVIGGIIMLTSGGNPSQYQMGVAAVKNAIIGMVLVMSSFLIFGFVLSALGFQEQNFGDVLTFQEGQLFEVQCDNQSYFTEREYTGSGVTAGNVGGGTSGGTPATGGGSGAVGSRGVACLDNKSLSDEVSAVMRTINVYEHNNVSAASYFILVGDKQKFPPTQKVHPRVIGCCNSTAYGRFQMIDTTWTAWAAAAGVPKNVPRTDGASTRTGRAPNPDYDMSPQYQDLAVAKALEKAGAATCSSFVRSSFRCQWTSIPGCSQPNPNTRNNPSAEAVCNQLLQDEKTGSCK